MGEEKNVFHIASTPKTLVFTAFSPLCTTHCAKHVEQETLSQASMPLATMPKTFVQHTVKGCGAKKAVTSVHAFGDHAQKHWC